MHPERLKAARAGEDFYPHTACPKCSCTRRYVSNGKCVDCARKKAKDRYYEEKLMLAKA